MKKDGEILALDLAIIVYLDHPCFDTSTQPYTVLSS